MELFDEDLEKVFTEYFGPVEVEFPPAKKPQILIQQGY
jgi:palmitoyl-protein thioesterase